MPEPQSLLFRSTEERKLAELVQRADPQNKLLRAWPLEGGVSAQVMALEVGQADGQTKKTIVRRHGEVDRKRNPQIAADEFKLLQIVHSAGIAAPAPYTFDQSGEIFPTPYIVLEYIEGETDFFPADVADSTLQMATHLVRIHGVKESGADLSFLPRETKEFGERPARVDDSLSEGRIRDALEAIWPIPQVNESVLLHGDYWPGNILWKDGQVVAVIDWEDARVGDPLADVANARLEILWAFGIDAMHSFTVHYQATSAIDFGNLPYWDLCAALRPASKLGEWGLDARTEETMRAGHHWFVDQVLKKSDFWTKF